MQPTRGAAKFLWLDWLRFLAAFEVLIGHARDKAFVDYSSLPTSDRGFVAAGFFVLTRAGYEAVIVFFVLSGFLVGGRAAEDALTGRFQLTKYVADRIARIMTPLVPAIALTVLVGLWIGHPVTVGQVAASLFSLQGVMASVPETNAPLWSLAFEVWFYVLAGAVAVAASRRRYDLPVLLITLASVLVLLRLGIAPLAFWAIGAAAWLRPRGAASSWEMVAGILVAAAGVTFYQLARPANVLTPIAGADLEFVALFGQFLIAAGMAFLLPNLRTVTGSDRALRWGSMGAAFSYTLYLTHYPVVTLLGTLLPKSSSLSMAGAVTFGVMVAASILVAALMYWLAERHTSVVKTWLLSLLPESRETPFERIRPAPVGPDQGR